MYVYINNDYYKESICYRASAAWKMKAHGLNWPISRYIKMEVPNAIIQISFNSLMKLKQIAVLLYIMVY